MQRCPVEPGDRVSKDWDFNMKLILTTTAALAMVVASHTLAASRAELDVVVASGMAGSTTGAAGESAHGGGCRKSSPPGQCCHAGSKPYHCH